MKVAQRYRPIRVFPLIVFIFLATGIAAQDAQNFLMWAKTSELQGGALLRQSDIDQQQNLFVVGLLFKEVPYHGDGNNLRNLTHILVRKYNTLGNLMWSRVFGGYDHASPGDIRVDGHGDIILSGYINDPEGLNFNQPIQGSFFCKMDNDGHVIWAKSLSNTDLETWGTTLYTSFGNECKMEIDVDNTILTYSSHNPPGDSHPSHGLYINRYSSDGELLNQYQLTYDQNANPSTTGGFAVDSNGNFVVTGYYYNGIQIGEVTFGIVSPRASTTPHFFLAKFSKTGSLMWAQSTTNGHSAGSDVAIDASDNIYLSGVTHGQLTIGDRLIHGDDSFTGFVTKLSRDGVGIWAKLISGTPTNVNTTPTGDLYITGSSWLGVTFDSHKLSGTGEEIFILKMNSDAEYESAMVSGSVHLFPLYKVAHNTVIDNAGNIYTIGIFQERVVFGCDTLASNTNDMLVVKYSQLPPLHPITISGPEQVCEGATWTLTSNVIPLPAEYSWRYPEDLELVDQLGTEVHLRGSLAADSAMVNIVVVKECYAYESARPYTVNMLDKPGQASIVNPTICDPAPTTIASNAAAHASSYVWTLPEGAEPDVGTIETSTPFVSLNFPPAFVEGYMTVRAKNECYEGEASAPVSIKLQRQPSPISFVNTAKEYCNDGEQKVFEVTPALHATVYVWTVPTDLDPTGTITSDTHAISVATQQTGPKTLQVYAKNDCYETEAITHVFEVVDQISLPVVEVSSCLHRLEVTSPGTHTWFKNNVAFAEDTSVVEAEEAGTYYVVSANACGIMQSNNIDFVPFDNNNLFIPNVITPNGDDHNPTFQIRPDAEGFQLDIFNRWGELVYESDNYQNDWNGAGADSGIYYIRIDHPCLPQSYKGWLHVLR